jgi:hypothetical protein
MKLLETAQATEKSIKEIHQRLGVTKSSVLYLTLAQGPSGNKAHLDLPQMSLEDAEKVLAFAIGLGLNK